MGCVQSSRRRGAASEPAWDGRVRQTSAWRVTPALTDAQLTRLRAEFWETRVEGRAEMWQALRFAAEADEDALRDETVKAAGLRPANKKGTLASVYDERGALYECPMYVLRKPDNLGEGETCAEFKDAARAVAEYVENNQRGRAGGRQR